MSNLSEDERCDIQDLLDARDPVIWQDDEELRLVPDRNYQWWSGILGHPYREGGQSCAPCFGGGCSLWDFYRSVQATMLRELSELGLLRSAPEAAETGVEYSIHDPSVPFWPTSGAYKGVRIRRTYCPDEATHKRNVGPWIPIATDEESK